MLRPSAPIRPLPPRSTFPPDRRLLAAAGGDPFLDLMAAPLQPGEEDEADLAELFEEESSFEDEEDQRPAPRAAARRRQQKQKQQKQQKQTQQLKRKRQQQVLSESESELASEEDEFEDDLDEEHEEEEEEEGGGEQPQLHLEHVAPRELAPWLRANAPTDGPDEDLVMSVDEDGEPVPGVWFFF